MARPSKWKRSTKMIRVPEEFEGQLLEIAHRLDNGEVLSFDSELENFDSELEEQIQRFLLSLSPKMHLQAKPWLCKFQKFRRDRAKVKEWRSYEKEHLRSVGGGGENTS